MSIAPEHEAMYAALDPGIRELVRALRARGWDTTDSGDGVSKVGGPMDVDGAVLPFPHVAVSLEHQSLFTAGALHSAHALERDMQALAGPGWYVELSYSTADGRLLLMAIGPSEPPSATAAKP